MVAMRAIVGMRINIRDANTAYTDFLVLNPYPCGFTGASARQIQKQAMFAKKIPGFPGFIFLYVATDFAPPRGNPDCAPDKSPIPTYPPPPASMPGRCRR